MRIQDFPTPDFIKQEVATGRFKTYEEGVRFYLEECGLLDYKTVDRKEYREIGRKGVFSHGKRMFSDESKERMSSTSKKIHKEKNFDKT